MAVSFTGYWQGLHRLTLKIKKPQAVAACGLGI